MVIRLLFLLIVPLFLSVSLFADYVNNENSTAGGFKAAKKTDNGNPVTDSVTEKGDTATANPGGVSYRDSKAVMMFVDLNSLNIANDSRDNSAFLNLKIPKIETFGSNLGKKNRDKIKLFIPVNALGYKAVNKDVVKTTNSVDVDNDGGVLSFSVIKTKPSPSTTTVGKAANQVIVKVTNFLDTNKSGEVLSFSVIKTKPSVAIVTTTADTNEVTADTTTITKDILKNRVIHYTTTTTTTDLDANTTTTTTNANVANMNNTKKTESKTATNLANSLFNSDTIGAATRALQDGDKKSIGAPLSA